MRTMNWVDRLLGRSEMSYSFPPLPGLPDGFTGTYTDAVLAGLVAGTDDVLSIPAVHRAVTFIQSACASMPPVAYRDGLPMDEQPRLCTKPSPIQTRAEFIGQTVNSMIEHREAFWWVPPALRDSEGNATGMLLVQDPESVAIDWDDSRIQPVYHWRGQLMKTNAGRDTDFIHIPLNRRAGQLHGHSWLVDCESSFATTLLADKYAADFFVSASIPSGVIKVPVKISPEEATKLKAQFIEGQRTRTPAVLSGGIDYAATQTNPYEAQLTDARRWGVSEVARASGIPAAILLVEMQGAFDVYTNLEAIYEEAARSTLFPSYLLPIEQAMSELLPRTMTVRFDSSELLRQSEKTRYDVYGIGVDKGILEPDEIRQKEGLPPLGAASIPPALRPTPMGSQPDLGRIPSA